MFDSPGGMGLVYVLCLRRFVWSCIYREDIARVFQKNIKFISFFEPTCGALFIILV